MEAAAVVRHPDGLLLARGRAREPRGPGGAVRAATRALRVRPSVRGVHGSTEPALQEPYPGRSGRGDRAAHAADPWTGHSGLEVRRDLRGIRLLVVGHAV